MSEQHHFAVPARWRRSPARHQQRLRRGVIPAAIVMVVGALVPGLMFFTPAHAANVAATLSQCTNGAVGPPPVLEQCAGSSGGGASILNGQSSASGYANWVSGNSNGSKSHWRENEFLSYRTQITAPPGDHFLEFGYDSIHSGGHAIDYLGSFDGTETTSTACPQTTSHGFTGAGCPVGFHANFNNPCADLVYAATPLMAPSTCEPNLPGSAQAIPTGTAPIPGTCAVGTSASSTCTDVMSTAAQTCGGSGSSGTVHADSTATPPVQFNQTPGTVDIFGPSGSFVGAVTYLDQNVPSGTGVCQADVHVAFHIGGSGTNPVTAVMAWGGHVASRVDWGVGNSAGGISGSPYHMFLNDIDGTTLGAQDRALAASALFFTPSITTSIDGNNTTSISAGSSVFDTATLSNTSVDSSGNPNATGTVTYNFFTNGTCNGTPLTTQNVTVAASTVPNSASTGPLTAGSYSFDASYGGDSANVGFPTNAAALSPCEPFTVLAAHINVTKTADAASVSAGTPIGFTVTVQNTGAGTATGVTLTDALPGGNAGTPVTWSKDTTTGNPTAFTLSGAAGSQSLTLAGQPITMAPGASLTVHITAPTTSTSCTTYNNTASVTTSNDGSSQASASEAVLCAQIKVLKTADAASVSAGSPIGFTVTVENLGSGTATGVILTDALPGGNAGSPVTWSIDTTTGNPTAFALGGAAGSQSLTLAGQPITMLAGATLTVHITAPTGASSCGATYNNTANVTTSNDGSSTASASEAVLCAQIQVTKTADAASVSAGSPIGFTVTVSNIGAGTATGVVLTDPLPGGNAGSPVTWSIDTTTGNPTAFALSGAAGSQSLSLAGQPISMAAGASLSVHITAPTAASSCGATYNNTATATTSNDGTSQASASESVLCAQIHITKTADAASVSAGTPIGFTVTVSNIGAGTATGVVLTDPLPGGNAGSPVTWSIDTTTGNPTAFTLTGAAGSQSLSLAGQPISMLSGASLTVHITAPTSASSCGATYNNTASVTTSNDGSSQASASETVLCAQINVTKTADADSVSAGTPIGFTVTVSNIGAGTATGVVLTDPLPAGNAGSPVTWSIDTTTGNPTAFTLTGAAGSQSLSLAGQPISLAAGASLSVHITAPTGASSCGATYNNTATATTSNDGTSQASASETVLCAQINVTKTADAASVSAGTPIGFAVTVSNLGAGTATGVVLTDPLPGGNAGSPVTWSIDTTTGNPTAFTLSGTAGSQSLSLAGQPISMAAGASLTVHITAPTGASSCGATYNNTATATTSNDGSSQASASETVLCAQIHITKTADAASVSAGTPIGFTVTVSNIGAGTVTGVVLTDPLPGGNAGSPVTWSIDTTTGNPAAFALSGTAGSQALSLAGQPISMLAGASLTVHITAPTSASSCGATYNNTASVTTSNDGTSQASASETVLCAQINVTKTADAASVSAGTPIGFTVTVSNIGAGTATGVVLTDPLPGGNAGSPVTWSIDTTTGNPTAFTLSGAAGSQSLSLAGQPISMLAGASLSVHITAPTSASSCGVTYNNTATATTSNDGTSQASASETVLCAQINVTKTADAASVSAGSPIGFTVTVSNIGAGTATGVVLTDPLPGGNAGSPVTWSIDTTTGNPTAFTITGAAGSQSLSLAGQPISMLAGASLSVHVTAPTGASSCGATYNNTATATTSNDGTSQASASETVLCAQINVTKTADAASVSAGSPIGFTVTVSNIGAGTATGVVLTDPLPGGNAGSPVTWSIDTTTGNPTAFSIAGAAGSQSLSLAGQPISMLAGASLSVHITAPTSASSCGATYNNTATATTSNDGTSQASASETVLCAQIHVTKTADAASVSAGTPIGFTVTVSNTGAGTATGVVLTDPLPGGNAGSPVTWGIDTTTGNPTAFTLSGAAGSQSLSLAGQPISMLAGASLSVHITAPTGASSCGATYNNTATATTSNDGTSQASASETVLCAQINVTKTADAASVSAGTPIGFTVTVSNIGAGTATGVVLTDPLPGGNAGSPVTWSIDTTTGNPTAFTLSGAAGSQSLSLAGQPITMLAGASLSVHITAPTGASSCGVTYNNTASATASNDGTSQASASETVLCAQINVTKTADAASVSAGTPIGFTVTVSNIGAGTATGVVLTDPLPGGNAGSPVTWSIDTTTGNPTAFTLSGAAGSQSLSLAGQPISMPAGASLTVHITAATSASSCGATYNNTATATTTNDGSSQASASESVLCANIGITKTADAASVIAGNPIGFTVTVSNTGAGTATGVVLTDPLPGGNAGSPVTWSIDTTTGNPTAFTISGAPGSQTLTLTGQPISMAAGATLQVHVTAPTSSSNCGATYNNTASVTTSNDGSSQASASEQVSCPQVSQITPTQTNCSDFQSGIAQTLSTVFYGTKGTTLSTDNPGVFFYWVSFTVSSPGTVTQTITQTTTYAPTSGQRYFAVANGSFAYSSSGCASNSALPTSIGGTPQAVTVTFTAPSAGTYIMGIKYSTKTIVGSSPAGGPGTTYNYTFATTGVGGSTSGLTLAHQ